MGQEISKEILRSFRTLMNESFSYPNFLLTFFDKVKKKKLLKDFSFLFGW